MSIFALTYTHKPSHDLVRMLNRSLTRYGVPHMIFRDANCEPVEGAINALKYDYSGGHGWKDAMHKINGYKEAIRYWDIKDDDWLMDMDDDTVFTSSDWIEHLKLSMFWNYSLAGIQHASPYDSAMGKFAHMSGACLCMRGWVVKKIINLDWPRIYNDIKNWKLAEVWDLVVSYGCIYAGAVPLNMSNVIDLSTHFEEYVSHRKGHFFHFNGEWKSLGGLPLKDGRYSIPGVLKQLGVEL